MSIINLQNKKILIIGSSSKIGKRILKLCIQLGAYVLLVDSKELDIHEIDEEAIRKNSKEYVFDRTYIPDIEKECKTILDENGSVDGLVFISDGEGAIIDNYDLKSFNRIMEKNYYSFIEIVRNLVKKNKTILNIVNLTSSIPYDDNLIVQLYNATRRATEASIRCIAKELSPYVRANSVHVENVISMDNKNDKYITESKKRCISNDETGNNSAINYVVYLLSDAASFITGTSITL